ncbi:hypothetical protein [Ancrocorticia populi]|uniref:hypothetical protein n=1 Tax=Ancrocorticia populi TaxID=2175228 RepID=UPI003F996878
MSTPNGEQPFNGEWPQQQSNGAGASQDNATPSRSALYFLIFAGVVLIISLSVIFYLKVLRTTAGAANIEQPEPTATSQAATTDSDPTEEASADPAEDARQTVSDLASSPACDSASGAAQSILTLANASDSADDEALIEDALTALSKECGAEYTVDIRNAFGDADVPESLATLVSSNDWVTLAKPAPDGASDVTEFTSPAENIRCVFGDEDVACSIYVYDYPSPDGCEGKTATYRVNESGDVDASCKEELNANNIIDYGTPVSHNGFACTIEQYEGTTCWNELTGNGFQLKRASDRTF